MPDLTLYSQDYGQRIKVNTWCDDITAAQNVYTRWKQEGTNRTHRLAATYTPDATKPAKRPIVTVIPANWLKDKVGLWIVTAEIAWSDADINGEPVTVVVERSPTQTTTTTSTTSTTSTTTTAP